MRKFAKPQILQGFNDGFHKAYDQVKKFGLSMFERLHLSRFFDCSICFFNTFSLILPEFAGLLKLCSFD